VTRSLAIAVLLVAGVGGVAHAQQVRASRSSQYLFVTNVADARALWVNPGGLGALPEASLFGEILIDRDDGGTRVGQWNVSFNSRGFSGGFENNLFESDTSYSVLRLGMGLPFPGGAFGFTVATYMLSGPNDRSGGLGVMWAPIPSVTIGGLFQNIGRPVVYGEKIPLLLRGGLQWSGLQGMVNLMGEAQALEVLDDSGFDMSYRGGATIQLRTKVPVGILGVVELGSSIHVDRWQMGFSIGGRSNATLVGTAVNRDDVVSFDTFSVAGIASNILTGR
jgi:hypothetical protein